MASSQPTNNNNETTLPPEIESQLPGGTLPPGTTVDDFLSGNMTFPPSLNDNIDNNNNATSSGENNSNNNEQPPNPNETVEITVAPAGPGEAPNFSFANPNVNASQEFLPERLVPYQKVSATKGMSGIPRFGHPRDFSYVAYLSTENADDGKSYIMGLLFVGLFLLAFFLIWTVVLLIFKFFLTGFLCGDPFINPNLDDPAEQKRKKELEEDGEEYTEDPSWLKRPRRIRIVFFICGFLQIVFAILMVTKGVANLQETTDTVQISTSEMRALLAEAIATSEDMKQVGETGFVLRDQIVFDLDKDNFCPGNPAFAQTVAGNQIVGAAGGAASMLTQLGDFIGDSVVSLEQGFKDAQRNLDEVDDAAMGVENNEWLGGLIAFPFLILSSLMMVGALAAQFNIMTECFLCLLNWVVLPIFIFVTNVSYIFLGLISIAASMNADFCGGETSSTPDKVIVDFMFRSGYKEDDMLFQTVRYYAFQCTREAGVDPFAFLRSFVVSIAEGREMVENLTQSMDQVALEQLSLGCNRDFRPLYRSLEQMVGVLDALLQSTDKAISLLKCQRIVPVYTDVVYSGTCTYSISGFAWIFSCLLIVSVMGMIMIMFRASYQNTIFDRPPALMDESSGTYHHRTREDGDDKKQKKKAKEDRWNDEDED